MLLNIQNKTESNCTIESKTFSIKSSPIAFEILSSKLYSDPTMAMVRELITNAYDSHKLADNLDAPIDLHFPDYMDENFSIRDYGIGLSKEDVLELYTTFFSSTKSDTNDFTGCFGLGSKTPFSYTSSFSINSYFNGTKYYFMAIKKDGYPNIICIKEEETEEHNGLEIIIPANGDNSILEKARNFLEYNIDIKVSSNKEIIQLEANHIFIKNSFKIRIFSKLSEYTKYKYNLNNCDIKQGQNFYSIKTNVAYTTFMAKLLKKCAITIEVPIGTLDITPSREALTTTPVNQDKLTAIIKLADAKIESEVKSNEKFWDLLEGSTVSEALTAKYFKDSTLPIVIVGTEIKTGDISFRPQEKVNICFLSNHKARYISYLNVYSLPIIVAPNYVGNQEFEKLRNICTNYNIELHMIETPCGHDYKVFTDEIKFIVNRFKELSDKPENISEVFTLEDILAAYPNQSKHRNNTNVSIHYVASYIGNNVSLNKTDDQASISYIKSSYPSDTTFLINSKHNYFKHLLFKDFYNLLKTYIGITNKEKHKFLLDYLFPNINDYSCTFNILGVYPSNLRYFKEYKKLDIDDLFHYISKQKYTLNHGISVLETIIPRALRGLRNCLIMNFKGKSGNFVRNSLGFKYIEPLIKYYENYKTVNKIDLDFLEVAKNLNLITDDHINSIEWSSIIPKILQDIHIIITNTPQHSFCMLKNVEEIIHLISNPYVNRSSKIKTHLLNVEQKDTILHILKGDKNVLF